MGETQDTQTNAVLNLQKIWRGQQTRKKYGLTPVHSNKLTESLTFLVGNDPEIRNLEAYASKEGKIALVGTSGLRSLELICELANKETIPKLIIIDNSAKVITFWRKLKEWVGSLQCTDQDEFNRNFEHFLEANKKLCLVLHENACTLYGAQGIEYENQNPVVFLNRIIKKHSLDYLVSIIKQTTVIGQTWTDPRFFLALKNILKLNGIDNIYAYPSNIEACVQENQAELVANCIQILDPQLSIRTDKCKEHRMPENVYLIPGARMKKRAATNKTTEADTANKTTIKHASLMNNLSERDEYQDALRALQPYRQDKITRENIYRLIKQVKLLRESGQVATPKLTQIFKDTKQFLDKKMEVDDYKEIAKTVQGHPSPGMQILGKIMMAIGAAIAVVGLVTTVAVSPFCSIAIGVGAIISAGAYGIFSKAQPSGLHEMMNDIADQQIDLKFNKR